MDEIMAKFESVYTLAGIEGLGQHNEGSLELFNLLPT